MLVIEAICVVLILIGLLLYYFKIAVKHKIIDKPNERSSHSKFTVRGAGVIFSIAYLLWWIRSGFALPWFSLGLVIIATLSFIDDIKELSVRLRLPLQFLAVLLLLFQAGIFRYDWISLVVLFIVVAGAINAYNFMDGINGITGLYSLSILVPLWLYSFDNTFIPSNLLLYLILSVLVFGFFNFRKKARAFAGDVGSVSMAFIVIFIILLLIQQDWDIKYILFLAVYGVDTVITIIHRLFLKENIFKAHRRHLYQYLSNEMSRPHLLVASIYAVIQLAINLWVLNFDMNSVQVVLFLFALALLYVGVKVYVIKRRRLLAPD